MKKLILTVGLPRSGKSTWSIGTGYPIVNRDSIRLALHGQAYISEAESMITAIERYMVESLFLAGHDTVIIDATHLKTKYIKQWIKNDRKIELEFFDTPMETCIERAIKGNKEHLVPIIERMYEETDEMLLEGFRKIFIEELKKEENIIRDMILR